MTAIAANGITIEYADYGAKDAPVVFLIMGLGGQLTLWPIELVDALVARGFRVIRYDNRDIGLSTKFDAAGVPELPALLMAAMSGQTPKVPYTLDDMAADGAALMDGLGIAKAHIVGASMGGMIAQVFAARHAARTDSLAIIFSSNNRAALPPPAPRALFSIIRGPKPGSPREVIIDNAVRVTRIIGSPAYPAPEDRIRTEAAASFDRSYYPVGIARQFGAILGSGSLRRYDRRITAPTVVIHGMADKLMRPAGGRAIAETIPGARLVLFPGMGHELPEELWDSIVAELGVTFAAGGFTALDSAS